MTLTTLSATAVTPRRLWGPPWNLFCSELLVCSETLACMEGYDWSVQSLPGTHPGPDQYPGATRFPGHGNELSAEPAGIKSLLAVAVA